jgi:hypothetical protein
MLTRTRASLMVILVLQIQIRWSALNIQLVIAQGLKVLGEREPLHLLGRTFFNIPEQGSRYFVSSRNVCIDLMTLFIEQRRLNICDRMSSALTVGKRSPDSIRSIRWKALRS